jgi:hypothetical protein
MRWPAWLWQLPHHVHKLPGQLLVPTCQLLTGAMGDLCWQDLVLFLLQCQWCPAANRCSSGMDRHRQDWLYKGCDKSALSNATQCPQGPANSSFTSQVSEDGPPNNIMGGETNSVAQTDHIQSTGEHSAIHGEWLISALSVCACALCTVFLIFTLSIFCHCPFTSVSSLHNM